MAFRRGQRIRDRPWRPTRFPGSPDTQPPGSNGAAVDDGPGRQRLAQDTQDTQAAQDTRVTRDAQPRPGDERLPSPTAVLPSSLRVLAAVAWRWLVVVAGIFVLLYVIRRLWMPFLALSGALFVTALLEPLARGLMRLHFPRALAALFSMIAAICVVGAVGYFVETRFVGSVSVLSGDLQSAVTNFNNWLHNGPLHLSSQQLTGYEDQLLSTIKQHRGSLASIGVAGLSSGVEIVSGTLIALFTAFFLLFQGERIWAWVEHLFPPAARPYVAAGGGAAWHALTGYVRGTVVVAAIDATCVCVGLLLLGVPLAVPLALIIFAGAFVPLVGAITTGVIAVLVALVAKGLVGGLVTLGLLVAVELLEGHFLQPLVIGRSVRIHPVAIVFAVAIGTTVAGVGGAVLAVPVVAVVSATLGSVYRLRRADRRGDNCPGEVCTGKDPPATGLSHT